MIIKTNNNIKNLKYLCKLHLEYCAILSQQNKHNEALDHAKYGVKYAHVIINQTINIIEKYISSETFNGKNYDPILEGLARKISPIICELRSMLIKEGGPYTSSKKRNFQVRLPPNQPSATRNINMRNFHGFCKISEWCSNINISSVMQISPITFQDLISNNEKEYEICRESLLEKISLVLIAYFCISTEKRFISQNENNDLNSKQAEFWHTKALELAYSFLPPDCPLLNHLYISYQKNYSVLQHSIVFLIK